MLTKAVFFVYFTENNKTSSPKKKYCVRRYIRNKIFNFILRLLLFLGVIKGM